MTHSLLLRQLKKLGLDPSTPPDPSVWETFLNEVEHSYSAADDDRYLLERSLAISSSEMQELYDDLKRSSEARYQAIVEEQTEFINRCTLDGKITFVNDAYANLHGQEPEDMIGHTHADFLSDEDVTKMADVRKHLTKDNQGSTSESRFTTPSGDEVWLQWRDRLIWDCTSNSAKAKCKRTAGKKIPF